MENNEPLQTLFKSNELLIETIHGFNATDCQDENLDFYITHKEKVYTGTAFTLDSISELIKNDTYFWCSDFIIISSFTSDCLVKAVLEIVADETIELDEVFYLNVK